MKMTFRWYGEKFDSVKLWQNQANSRHDRHNYNIV